MPQKQLTVFVVEDDPAISDVVCTILSGEGYQTVPVSTIPELKSSLKKTTPDLILLDYWLKETNGPQVIQFLKDDDAAGNVPVVVVTGSSNIDRIRKEPGVAAVLSKPFEMDDLINIVHQHIKN